MSAWLLTSSDSTQPFVLSASDDMTIKCWDWEKGWKCIQVYEGHSHYVMGLAINPKDTSLFASACLDRTVKVWSVRGRWQPPMSYLADLWLTLLL